jgi:uncharacterized membrane protein required for colicin V production
MISLMVVFYIFLITFAIIGGLRGWAKELLVVFSVVLAFFLIFLLEKFSPDVQGPLKTQFWARTVILIVLVFFGYQTTGISRLAAAVRRERVQDFILGIIFGAVNGYLIIGTIWSYMDSAHYPFFPLIISPTEGDPLGVTALNLISKLPPMWLGNEPWIYIAVGAAFLFVLVVFI